MFESNDSELAQELIDDMHRNLTVEQIQPGVIRLTEIGYVLIKPDLNRIREEIKGSISPEVDSVYKLQRPTVDEILNYQGFIESGLYL